MNTRIAPYRHPDGSACWTKNCRLGNTASVEENIKNKLMEDVLKFNQSSKPVALISSIATQEVFDAAVARGEVSRQRHPLYPYSIYKYSQSTTYSKNWNDVTMASRGLIVNDETGEILARPFGKFFNYSEGATPEELMVGPISVSEKLDGSLGILYDTPDGKQISTAGGFQSSQAAHATRVYQERYEGKWKPRKGVTYLYEIIYPENRIVVDYAGEDDIHLLGAVNIRTGKSIPISELKEWKWKKATEHTDLEDIDSVVNAPNRSNHEGYIVHFLETDTRVKLKHDEYLRHHRYATGVNSRRIWEMLRDSESEMDSWKKNIPEEFEDYIKTTIAGLQSKYDAIEAEAKQYHQSVLKSLPSGFSQKDFAVKNQTDVPQKYRGLVFSLQNRGEIVASARKSIWDMFKPDHESSIWSLKNGREASE